MTLKLLAFSLMFTLGLLLASGCDDGSPVEPDLPAAFSLHITVQDDAGEPVPGLTARLFDLHAFVPAVPEGRWSDHAPRRVCSASEQSEPVQLAGSS